MVPPFRSECARHGAKQRRLTDAVRPDDRHDAAVDRERDVTQQRPAAACQLDALEGERHHGYVDVGGGVDSVPWIDAP